MQLDQRRAGDLLEKDVLEQGLGEVYERRRRHRAHRIVLPLVGEDADLLAGEGRDEAHPAAVRHRGRAAPHLVEVEAARPADLEAARVERMRLGRTVARPETLDDKGTDTLSRQEDGGHEADRAGADDKHYRLTIDIVLHLLRSADLAVWK